MMSWIVVVTLLVQVSNGNEGYIWLRGSDWYKSYTDCNADVEDAAERILVRFHATNERLGGSFDVLFVWKMCELTVPIS